MYDYLIRALMATGGPVQVTRQPSQVLGYQAPGENRINLNPDLYSALFGQVARHEVGHELQDRTIGTGPENISPVDAALRGRLGIPRNDPNTTRMMNENAAEFMSRGRTGSFDPLTAMATRALVDSIFRSIYAPQR